MKHECSCTAADKCPLGRTGSQDRCTADELRNELRRDLYFTAWTRETGNSWRKRKSHHIDELVILTRELVEMDNRLGGVRMKLQDMINKWRLQLTIMGETTITVQDVKDLMSTLNTVAGDRAIHQDHREQAK